VPRVIVAIANAACRVCKALPLDGKAILGQGPRPIHCWKASELRAFFGRAARSLNERAVLLLVLTTAMWGANGVVSRAAVGAVAPMTLVALRWLFVCAVLLPIVRTPFLAHLPELRRNWRFLTAMALCGFTGFNVLFYLAGYWTSAVNITLLQGAIPPMVFAGAALFKGEAVTPRQVAGMSVSFLGVGLIATRGDLAHIGDLSFNLGDLMMLAACALYAGYTIALRGRPHLPPLVFFAGMAVAAFAASLPFLAAEIALGRAYWPSGKGFALVIFVALAPSLLSQLFFMRAVELIGPGRAGIFSNLTPLFGASFAIVLLGEPFHLYHAGAMALGLAGIALAESVKRRKVVPHETP
jgi:drug/metabolite transporter (DMT)-like permease